MTSSLTKEKYCLPFPFCSRTPISQNSQVSEKKAYRTTKPLLTLSNKAYAGEIRPGLKAQPTHTLASALLFRQLYMSVPKLKPNEMTLQSLRALYNVCVLLGMLGWVGFYSVSLLSWVDLLAQNETFLEKGCLSIEVSK